MLICSGFQSCLAHARHLRVVLGRPSVTVGRDLVVWFQYQPTVRAVVEVQSKRVEIYNASLKIHAKFSGLRCVSFFTVVVAVQSEWKNIEWICSESVESNRNKLFIFR